MKFKATVKIKGPWYLLEYEGKIIGRLSREGAKIVKDGETIETDFWGLHGKDVKDKNYVDNCSFGFAYLGCKSFEEEPLFGKHLSKKEYKEKKSHHECDICKFSNLQARLYFVFCNKCGQNH